MEVLEIVSTIGGMCKFILDQWALLQERAEFVGGLAERCRILGVHCANLQRIPQEKHATLTRLLACLQKISTFLQSIQKQNKITAFMSCRGQKEQCDLFNAEISQHLDDLNIALQDQELEQLQRMEQRASRHFEEMAATLNQQTSNQEEMMSMMRGMMDHMQLISQGQQRASHNANPDDDHSINHLFEQFDGTVPWVEFKKVFVSFLVRHFSHLDNLPIDSTSLETYLKTELDNDRDGSVTVIEFQRWLSKYSGSIAAAALNYIKRQGGSPSVNSQPILKVTASSKRVAIIYQNCPYKDGEFFTVDSKIGDSLTTCIGSDGVQNDINIEGSMTTHANITANPFTKEISLFSNCSLNNFQSNPAVIYDNMHCVSYIQLQNNDPLELNEKIHQGAVVQLAYDPDQLVTPCYRICFELKENEDAFVTAAADFAGTVAADTDPVATATMAADDENAASYSVVKVKLEPIAHSSYPGLPSFELGADPTQNSILPIGRNDFPSGANFKKFVSGEHMYLSYNCAQRKFYLGDGSAYKAKTSTNGTWLAVFTSSTSRGVYRNFSGRMSVRILNRTFNVELEERRTTAPSSQAGASRTPGGTNLYE